MLVTTRHDFRVVTDCTVCPRLSVVCGLVENRVVGPRERSSREDRAGGTTREVCKVTVKVAFDGNELRNFQLNTAGAMTFDSAIIGDCVGGVGEQARSLYRPECVTRKLHARFLFVRCTVEANGRHRSHFSRVLGIVTHYLDTRVGTREGPEWQTLSADGPCATCETGFTS